LETELVDCARENCGNVDIRNKAPRSLAMRVVMG
jgi:hypothetical protein